MFPAHKQ